jgi:hypothetical protein
LATTAASATPGATLGALLALAGTVWVCSLLGIVIAAASRSITETALFSAVILPLIAHMSGVFRRPAPGTLSALVESASPLRALHEALAEMTVSVPASGGIALAIWAAFLPALVWALGAKLHAALGRVTRGGLEGA